MDTSRTWQRNRITAALLMALLVGFSGARGTYPPEKAISNRGISVAKAAPEIAVTSISAGGYHTCTRLDDGRLNCWGLDSSGQASPPAGQFDQVDAGGYHSCALRTDGSLACWGANDGGQTDAPEGQFSQVSIGGYAKDGQNLGHSCALANDGSLVCWGSNVYGEADPPPGTFVQVEAGRYHSCAIDLYGSLICWGNNEYGQSPHIALRPGQLADGTLGQPYRVALTDWCSLGKCFFSLNQGELPPGLELSPEGVIRGVPQQTGIYEFAVVGSDTLGVSGKASYSITVQGAVYLPLVASTSR